MQLSGTVYATRSDMTVFHRGGKDHQPLLGLFFTDKLAHICESCWQPAAIQHRCPTLSQLAPLSTAEVLKVLLNH